VDDEQRPERLTVVCTGASAAIDLTSHLTAWRQVLPVPVTVVLTSAALTFVNPVAIRLLADEVVEPGTPSVVNPIGLANRARLLVVCPASANFVVSAALGLAYSPALTTVLAMAGPTVFFPHMNPVMWRAETTRSAVRSLRERGRVVVSPERSKVLTLWDRRFVESHALPPPQRTAEIVTQMWRQTEAEVPS
jgi:phosphopantothenoylcysteine synthetase/decarboxylase